MSDVLVPLAALFGGFLLGCFVRADIEVNVCFGHDEVDEEDWQ
jgi:hypothetical protein